MPPIIEVISDTISRLRDRSSGSFGAGGVDKRKEPNESSMMMSSINTSQSMELSRMDVTMDLDVIDDAGEGDDIDSGSSATSILGGEKLEPAEIPRRPEKEPWVWLNTMISQCDDLLRISDKPKSLDTGWGVLSKGTRRWSSQDAQWIVSVEESGSSSEFLPC